MGNFKRLSSLVSLLILFTGVSAAWSVSHHPVDGNQVPVVVTPSDLVIEPGGSATVTVTLSGTTTNNQTVNVSSTSAAVSVPSTVTVLAGHDSATFTATASVIPGQTTPVLATITAECNNGNAQGSVVIDY